MYIRGQTCIYFIEGMSNNERNRITLSNGRAESTLIDSDTTGANENLNSTGILYTLNDIV